MSELYGMREKPRVKRQSFGNKKIKIEAEYELDKVKKDISTLKKKI